MTKSKLLAVFLVLVMGIFANTDASFGAEIDVSTSETGSTVITPVNSTIVTITPTTAISQDGKYSLSTYSKFNIATGEKAVVLLHSDIKYSIHRMDNNVNPMNIYGILESRQMQGSDFADITGPIYGHLILISPAGIHIGPNAVINAGSITMTTASAVRIKDSNENYVDLNSSSLDEAAFTSITLKDFSTNVVEFAGISNSIVVNSSIDGTGALKRGIIKTATPTSVNKATIDFVAGSIINKGIIGDSDIVNYQTNNVNLIAANKVVKNSDNTFGIIDAALGNQGSVYLSPTSVVRGNNITIKALGNNPTSPGTNGVLTNTAINVEGKVNAYALDTNSGIITLKSGNPGATSGNKIYLNHVGGTTEKLRANGTNAHIAIKAPELWYKNGLPGEIVVSQGTKSINAGVVVIDPPPPPPPPPAPSPIESNEIQATAQVIKPQTQPTNPISTVNPATNGAIVSSSPVESSNQPVNSNPLIAESDSTSSNSSLGFGSSESGAETTDSGTTANTDSSNTQTQESTSDSNQQTNQETQANNNEQENASKEEAPQETTITINKQKIEDFYGDLFLKAMFERNSKEAEYNADLNAVRITSMLNYHPAAMAGFLMKVRRLEKESSGSNKVNTVFIYRHPETISRLVKVRNQIADLTFNNGIADTINQQRFQNAVFTLKK